MARELTDFVEIWKGDAKLSYYLLSPMYPEDQRRQALLAVMKSCCLQDLSQRFLTVIFDRNRLVALPEIVLAFTELAERQAGLVRVEVKVARPLEAEEQGQIERILQQKIGGHTVISWKIAPEILGGMIVVYEGKILDGSVSGRLTKLAETLSV